MKPQSIPMLVDLRIQKPEPQYNLVVEFEGKSWVKLHSTKCSFFGPYKTKEEADEKNKVIEDSICWENKLYIALPVGTKAGTIFRCLYPKQIDEPNQYRHPFYFETKREIVRGDIEDQKEVDSNNSVSIIHKFIARKACANDCIIVGYHNQWHPKIFLDRSRVKPIEGLRQDEWTFTLTTAFVF